VSAPTWSSAKVILQETTLHVDYDSGGVFFRIIIVIVFLSVFYYIYIYIY